MPSWHVQPPQLLHRAHDIRQHHQGIDIAAVDIGRRQAADILADLLLPGGGHRLAACRLREGPGRVDPVDIDADAVGHAQQAEAAAAEDGLGDRARHLVRPHGRARGRVERKDALGVVGRVDQPVDRVVDDGGAFIAIGERGRPQLGAGVAVERGDPAAQVDKEAAAAGRHLGIAQHEAVADGDKRRGGLEDIGGGVGVELGRCRRHLPAAGRCRRPCSPPWWRRRGRAASAGHSSAPKSGAGQWANRRRTTGCRHGWR